MKTVTAKCEHEHVEAGEHFGFSTSVNPYDENRAAHGSICYTETCRKCGAERDVNQNQGHYEIGLWGPDKATRDRIERQKREREQREREAAEDAALKEAGVKVVRYTPTDRHHWTGSEWTTKLGHITVSRHGREQTIMEWECEQAAAQRDEQLAAMYRAILRHARSL